MTRMFVLAVYVAIGAFFNTEILNAQWGCPTDNSPCEWKEMFVKNERLTQIDTIVAKDGKVIGIQLCSRFFSINVCYRCCNGKLEIRLSSIVPCDSNKYLLEKDWTRGCKWRYDTWFWKQVDDAIM